MSPERLLPQIPTTVPVFPLPGVVFFPHSVLPLHIFEPRYRAMVADALKGDGLIAMALPKPGWEPNYYANPEVFPIGCVGRMDGVESLPDGRFNLKLNGVVRVRFLEFLQEQPYRVARVEAVADSPVGDTGGRRDAELELLAAYSTLKRAMSDEESGPMLAVNPGLSFPVLVDSLCLFAEVDSYDKQKLLELPNVEKRCAALTELLSRRLDEAIARGEVDKEIPPGLSVN